MCINIYIYYYIFTYIKHVILSHLVLPYLTICQGSHDVLATEGAVLVASPAFPHQSVRTRPAQTREHQDLELVEALIDESGTPWKINMKPTHHPFRKENDLPNLHDYAPC